MKEGRYPDVIFEFLSPSTRRIDQTTKKTLYEQTFRTREYYWYDPFDPREFQGWQLHPDSGYQAMTPDAARLDMEPVAAPVDWALGGHVSPRSRLPGCDSMIQRTDWS